MKENAKTASMDMLHGPMVGKMLLFALPLAAGSILQQLFNAVDVAVVGRFASSEALAAVGSNTSVVSLLINLFVGISVGSNVVIANLIGRKEQGRVKDAVHTSILLALISGILMLVVGILIARPLLSLMSTPDNIMTMAVLYLRIYCIGMPFIMLYNFSAAILRSIGDTKRPLYCLVTAGVINACLNLFFVIVLHMAVAGVATATVISNVVSSGMALFFLCRSDETVRPELKKLRLHKDELVQILKIGVPAGVQGVVFSIANVCIQSSINSFGSDAVAGSSVASNFEMFSYYMVSGFNSAVMTFMSQNLGAGKLKRCLRAYGIGIASALICTFAMNGIFFLLRHQLVSIFTADAAVANLAYQRMRYVLLFHFMICSYEVTGSALRGLGKSFVPALLSIFGTCLLRVAYVNTVVIKFHSFPVLMSVYPISWAVTGAVTLLAFFIVWRRFVRQWVHLKKS